MPKAKLKVIESLYELGDSWWAKVTVAKARQLLDGQHVNRKLSDRVVAAYATDMKKGNWRHTPIPILIDTKGRLFDGQHRIAAVVKSRNPQEFLFVVSNPDELMEVLDTGKKRSFSDVLAIKGVKNSSYIGSTVRLYSVIQQYQNNPKSPKIADKTTLEKQQLYLSIDADLWQKGALIAFKRTMGMTKLRVAGAACFVAFALIDREKADLFFNKLCSGQDMGAHDPILTLRETALRLASDKTRSYSLRTKLFLIVRAWNAWCEGAPLRNIKVTGVDFPKINEPI